MNFRNSSYYRFFYTLYLLMLIAVGILAAQSPIAISAKATTTATGGDVDDCAIWVHPTDPAKSVVIVNDKGVLTGKGGLYVYDLSGALLQKVAVYQPQNPDIRYNVVFGSDTIDALVCVDRAAGNTAYNKVRVFKIDPKKAQATSGFLTEITTSEGIPTGQSEVYGHSLYMRLSDRALFSIVSPNSKADFTQIKLESDGKGKVKGTIVRTWGRDDISGDLCEGIACDDELGFIYICDENTCVLKYQADPDKKTNALVGTFAQRDGIVSDREGINIYRCNDNTGYILVSSQGNDQIKVYDRGDNGFLGTLSPEGMKDCDGLDVTAVPLGSQFPHGMATFHLGSTAGSQFNYYDWSDIATGLKLATPCDAVRPYGSIKASELIPQTASSPDFQQSSHIRLFPNKILLRFAPSTNGMVNITLYRLNGQSFGTIYNGLAGNNEITIPLNVRLMRPGAYLIKISAGKNVRIEELVIAR